MPTAPKSPPPTLNAAKPATAARTPEMIQNFCVDQESPAWVMRVLRGTDFSFSRRASRSFSDPSTCSRRERWLLSA